MAFVNPSELLTVREVSVSLRCSTRYVAKLCETEQIAHFRFGRKIMFDPAAVQDFLQAHHKKVFIQPEKKSTDPLKMFGL